MKNSKKSLITRRHELMKKRFDVDEENKIVKLDLHYESVDEVLDEHLDTKVASFNREKFAAIQDIVSDFPLEYKVDVGIKIDDYKQYRPEEIMDGFKDAVELTLFSGTKEHRKKWIQITFLLIAGILVLYLIGRGILGTWTGMQESTQEVFREVLDITAWVFIWQAVSLMFLTPTEERLIYLTLAKRINDICLYDKDYNLLMKETFINSSMNNASEIRIRTVGKYALLVTGALFFALGLVNIIDSFVEVPMLIVLISENSEPPVLAAGFIMIFTILVVAIMEILGGLAAIAAFVDKRKKLQKLIIPFGSVVFVLELLLLIYNCVNATFSLAPIVASVAGIAYLTSGIILSITKQK